MSFTGLVPCRLNNPHSFIFFPRSCFPNLSSFFLPSPWTPSSWLLTVLCPKLDVKPFQTLNGVEGLFCVFSLHILKQCFFEECGWGALFPCTTVWHLRSQVRDPFPSQMRCPVHMDQAWEDLSWDTSLQAWSPAPGSEPKQAGEQKKSCPLSRALAAQVPGVRREGYVTGWFPLLVWEPPVNFLPPYSTKPGQTATPTQPNTSSQTFFCRTTTESASFCLMHLDISISL